VASADAASAVGSGRLSSDWTFLGSYWRRRQLFLFMMGLPAVAYVLFVAVWPVAQGISYSLFDYNLTRPASRSFVGLRNYIELFADRSARAALVNTFVFTAGAVAIEFAAGLGIAFLLWRDDLFNRVCLALLLVPVTVTPLVAGLVFKALFAADYGMVGYYAASWGLSPPRGFFADPATALATLVLVDAWQWTPLMALILLAGLKALPPDILEAAEVDGATMLQMFRIVIFPLLLPSVFLAVMLRTMDAFRVFDTIFVTTGGGPADATNTLMFHAVKQGLEFFNIGFASAVANVMNICIAGFAIAFIALIRRADVQVSGR
jgi:multiple sugar transport system permease protein